MQHMNLYLQGGDVVLRCAGCDAEYPVDVARAFVPQLHEVTEAHRCPAERHLHLAD
jgi:hypothetical protein